ncbi:MAG: hypothetical protein MI741_19405, partial [Rhodospirillales bacterium]|nr:hypothetical protein [Rhodospirillales bacterium]
LMLFFGAAGVLFKKLEIPAAPVLLGSILGPMVERNFRRTLQFAEFNDESAITFLISRPISAVLLVLVLVLIYSNFRKFFRKQRVGSDS